jgi:hypothetical protein
MGQEQVFVEIRVTEVDAIEVDVEFLEILAKRKILQRGNRSVCHAVQTEQKHS